MTEAWLTCIAPPPMWMMRSHMKWEYQLQQTLSIGKFPSPPVICSNISLPEKLPMKITVFPGKTMKIVSWGGVPQTLKIYKLENGFPKLWSCHEFFCFIPRKEGSSLRTAKKKRLILLVSVSRIQMWKTVVFLAPMVFSSERKNPQGAEWLNGFQLWKGRSRSARNRHQSQPCKSPSYKLNQSAFPGKLV